MTHAHDGYVEGDFPWLPGQAHVTPNPAYSFRENGQPPRWLMVTLESLVDRADPEGLPPKSWLAAIKQDRDCVDAMRAFGRECFNVLDTGEGEATRWYAPSGGDLVAEQLTERDAWWRIWSGYTRLILADLDAAQENVGDALTRIPTQWAAYVANRSRVFWTHYQDASVWPPRLALVWILYGGNRDAVCAYFSGSVERSKRPDLLDWIGFSLDGDDEIVNPKPTEALAIAMRRSATHPERVKVKGLLQGAAVLSVIDPDDLARLEWLSQEGANFDATAILAPVGYSSTSRLPVISNVMIDRESLWVAFPPALSAPVAPRRALKPETFAADHKETTIARIRMRGETPTTEAIAADLMAQYQAAGGGSDAKLATWERYVRKAG